MSPSPQKAVLFSSAAAVEEAFYDALKRGDHAAMMALWAEDEEVVCVHPGQARLTSFASVSASWKGIFQHQGGIAIQPTQCKVFESATQSVHCVIEEIVDDHTHQLMHSSAVNVYTRGGSGWRILMHHSSPADASELTAASVGAMLH